MSRPGYVYRAFDADGALLYIGATLMPGRRFASHQSQTDWWDEVASLSIERFPSREHALIAESDAIRREKPRYNVVTSRGLVNPDEQERRRREREFARFESWLESTYVPVDFTVRCSNCGHRPERLPKAHGLETLRCKRCDNRKTFQREPIPSRRLRSVPDSQQALDLNETGRVA